MSKNEPINEAQPDSDSTEEEDTVAAVTPDIWIDHNDKTYFIDIQLPGVKKEHIDLSVGEQSICIQAARTDEPIVYLGCFSLAHQVDEEKAKAKFENWVLRVEIPLKAPLTVKRIPIE